MCACVFNKKRKKTNFQLWSYCLLYVLQFIITKLFLYHLFIHHLRSTSQQWDWFTFFFLLLSSSSWFKCHVAYFLNVTRWWCSGLRVHTCQRFHGDSIASRENHINILFIFTFNLTPFTYVMCFYFSLTRAGNGCWSK